MNVQLFDLANPGWSALLTRVVHDIDHVPEVLAAYDEFRGAPSRLAVVEGDGHVLAVPLRLRENADGSLDASSSEVRSAPVFSEGAPAEWRRDAIGTLIGHLRLRGVASLFLRFHPLLDSSIREFARFGAAVSHGETYDVPLDRSLDEIRDDMRRNHRRGIRKFRDRGYVCEQDVSWSRLDEFHDLYSRTMERVGASDDYRFSREFFERLRDGASEHIMLWTTVVDDELAMAHLVSECGGIVQTLYAGVHPNHQPDVPQIGQFDAELEWAHSQGHHDFFIDGGDHESLRHFKAGITEVRPIAASVRIVVDPVAFGRNCAAWERETGRSVELSDQFFPPYRRPERQRAHV
ncbi:GNAT family N-acetyltransferase [Gulosibacter faecalis]|uniref:GNAT family N-acetyltransferase n=1 Tax=Gulosibacter faecalis TaxID=272240 RepID=A0ABW5UWP2_9MICO|nr:GNAT family N-acetyltransferase [Gulosibacter faecalis]